MRKILVPVDGSENANRALAFAVAAAKENPAISLLIVNVQFPIRAGLVHELIGNDLIDKFYADEGNKILEPAGGFARKNSVNFTVKVAVGVTSETVADCVRQENCDHVVMGTRGVDAMKNVILGSVAYQVIHLVDVPVTVVR